MAEIAKYNDKERAQYDNSWKTYWDNENTLAYAKKEGREEGDYGRVLRTIKNALEKGSSLQYISDIIELSVEQVRQIMIEQGWKEN